jgi:hypothetical protein
MPTRREKEILQLFGAQMVQKKTKQIGAEMKERKGPS